MEALRGIHVDHVQIVPAGIAATIYGQEDAYYLAADGEWVGLPAAAPDGWLVHDIDLALIPVVLASGPVPCEQPLVVIRPLITTLSFEVTCGGEISYYFDGEGARIPELDLVTAEGIDEALAEILAEPLAVAASGQVELVVLHQSEGVMDLAVTVQYEDAAGILLRRGGTLTVSGKPLSFGLGERDPQLTPFDSARLDGAGSAAALQDGAAQLGIDLQDPAASSSLYIADLGAGSLIAQLDDLSGAERRQVQVDFTEAGQ